MVFTDSDLQDRFATLRQDFKNSVANIEAEFEDHENWVLSVLDGVKNGTINFQSVLVPKTPGKKPVRAPLHAIRESLESSVDIDEDELQAKPKTTKNKKVSKNTKIVQPKKRISEEIDESASKRVCQSRPSETVSRDSGLSSGGSHTTRGSIVGGVVVKEEVLTPEPKSKSPDTTFTYYNAEETSLSPANNTKTLRPSRKRTQSADRGTFVLKEDSKRVSRSLSESRKSTAPDETFTLPNATDPKSPCKVQEINALRSPMIKAPSIHHLKGESVKKAVKAFEALTDGDEVDVPQNGTSLPKAVRSLMPPPAKIIPPASQTSTTSLDDAVNAPTRLTRTKTRALAKAAAEEESKANTSKIQDNTFSSSKFLSKPFGSCSKTNTFMKPSTPLLNRLTPMTPNTSISVPRNLITSVESFIAKPILAQEVKSSREENLQKLFAKAEVASKKKEEIMKAQLEEKMKKRQEKRLKVCAAREAMEKEKLEMHLKLEREREERQQQLQREREEKIRQEHLKKKRLALQKAAETEERRRQEEVARLAKLKQQEEEQKRIAAQRQRELEEAERKQQERLKQEREAAALRIKEAERLAKETKRPPGPQSYGLTPAPEDRYPKPASNPDNYGIDDVGTDDSSEDESKPKKVVPLWAQSKQRVPKLLDDYEVTLQQIFVFFGSKKSTPDLSKIFTSIDRRQLLRKSSAVWRTPPAKYQQYYHA